LTRHYYVRSVIPKAASGCRGECDAAFHRTGRAFRRAEELAQWSTPENIAFKRAQIEWMRRCNATPGNGRSYVIGAEMDGRTFSDHEIATAEAYLAECEAFAALAQRVAA
jgi:hypothetical protein